MILLVDDDRSIVEWQVDFLKISGFDAVGATTAEEAFVLFSEHGELIRCVVSDVTLPGKNGVWLAQTFAELAPEIPVVLCTGYDNILPPSPNVPTVLIKPFGPMLLLKAIRDAIIWAQKRVSA